MGSVATLLHLVPKSVEQSEYEQATSEFATSYDAPGHVDGVEGEYDRIISDLDERVEQEYDRSISEHEESYHDQYDQSVSDLDESSRNQYEKIVSELQFILSDLNQRAEDQCERIIANLQKALEISPENADACRALKILYDTEAEYDLAGLQDDYAQIETIKHFRMHIDTCDIYAIEQRPDGTLIGSCGPLPEDDLKDLDSYVYSDEKNDWVQKNIDRLILHFPEKQVQEIF